jgi:hypothetical protein
LVIGDVRTVATDGDFTDVNASVLVIPREQFTKFANEEAGKNFKNYSDTLAATSREGNDMLSRTLALITTNQNMMTYGAIKSM